MSKLLLSVIDEEALGLFISEKVIERLEFVLRKPSQPSSQSDKYITIIEATKFLRLSKATIYSKVSKNEIPGVYKRGKFLYFDKEVLIEWIKQGKKKTTAEIQLEAQQYIANTKKGCKNGK